MTLVLSQFDVDAAIVDLDGTLVDTLGDFVVVLNLMLADLPPPYRSHRVDRATVAQLVGKGSEYLIKSILALVSNKNGALHSGQDELDPLYSQAWPSYLGHYLAVNGQHATVYPGVMAGLKYLKRSGLRLACLTNKPTAFALTLLKAKGLDGFFDLTFGGDAYARKKPDPLPLLKTCEALACAPQRVLMIGDSSNDAQAARAAGCPVLLVSYGYNHGEPIQTVDADRFVDSLQDLIPTLT